ncbi:MAG: UDP-N-acetylmuramoyl-L-alanine--D-glutamate ligase [Spirochaetaceae bacterium]|jgi:UDP-N-acetylmuramoylalanine--D-glutamate ligase|nr:UDP-N-acetylmuramoyl-L-alanine--D-glutamate ligase [Spirochaetaceae bacterium]
MLHSFNAGYAGADSYAGMKVLVMGLGLHGGGAESARYLAGRGADITVTDLRDEARLAPSLEQLRGIPIRYVLGRHDTADFEQADMVIKNPGVRPDSPFLKASRRIETDISLFLAHSPARLTVVTGSKGKSTTASAIQWVLAEARNEGILQGASYLGGNITVSPLTFLDRLRERDDAILELSSWQLGDLRRCGLLKPRVAVITAILPDHLNWYGSMESYVADKRVIYQEQDQQDSTVAFGDAWGESFHAETRGRPLVYAETPLPAGSIGGWLTGPQGPGLVRLRDETLVEAVPATLRIPGYHQKKNMLAASLALLDLGLPAEFVRDALGRFPGIAHRLEFFHEAQGIRFYNDTAATIPEAAAAAVAAFDKPPVLVTGGTDKNLDFTPLARAASKAKALILLAGTGADKLAALLDAQGIRFEGPFDTVDAAVIACMKSASPGDTVVLSPGCASFGMFLNEFERGSRWKEAVIRLTS